jgi:hypothetical protein
MEQLLEKIPEPVNQEWIDAVTIHISVPDHQMWKPTVIATIDLLVKEPSRALFDLFSVMAKKRSLMNNFISNEMAYIPFDIKLFPVICQDTKWTKEWITVMVILQALSMRFLVIDIPPQLVDVVKRELIRESTTMFIGDTVGYIANYKNSHPETDPFDDLTDIEYGNALKRIVVTADDRAMTYFWGMPTSKVYDLLSFKSIKDLLYSSFNQGNIWYGHLQAVEGWNYSVGTKRIMSITRHLLDPTYCALLTVAMYNREHDNVWKRIDQHIIRLIFSYL